MSDMRATTNRGANVAAPTTGPEPPIQAATVEDYIWQLLSRIMEKQDRQIKAGAEAVGALGQFGGDPETRTAAAQAAEQVSAATAHTMKSRNLTFKTMDSILQAYGKTADHAINSISKGG